MLDLGSNYWKVAMDVNTQKKAVFITQSNWYEWNMKSFGCCDVPGTFGRLKELVLKS